MERSKRSALIKQLKRDGFRVVTGFSYLYINPHGKIYDLQTFQYLKPTKQNYIKPESKYLSVPKLVLQAFANQPYRNGRVNYLDGNKSNLAPENLRYSRKFSPTQKADQVNPENLLKAIRCYFQVQKQFKVKDIPQTKQYLKQLTHLRGFFVENYKNPNIEVYQNYLHGNKEPNIERHFSHLSISETAKRHGLTVRDCTIIVHRFTNQLVTEILQDLEKGLLTIQEHQPKPLTQTQVLREYNKELIKRGQTPLPLRKRSQKETLKDFQKKMDEIKQERTPNQEPPKK